MKISATNLTSMFMTAYIADIRNTKMHLVITHFKFQWASLIYDFAIVM